MSDPPADSEPPVVVVVDPQTPGNVGTIARAMKNFGFRDLRLVDPPPLDPDGEAFGYAGQAREDVLPGATETTLEAVRNEFHTVGFTAITNEDASSHVRYPFRRPDELAEALSVAPGRTALVFGRERTGLHNEELARLDEICAIPANPAYPVLNLGQAATVALYELRELTLSDTQLPNRAAHWARPDEIERFYDHVGRFLDELEYPPEKRPKTMRLIRRVFGRARPTGRELATLRGLLRRATRRREE
ncbi:MAG: RNA methyltransferase [Halodesulfurarchaeum sp.]